MNQDDAPRVSFVIPVLNDAERLRRCLESIARNDVASLSTEVVVADNGSTDGSSQVALDAGARVLALPGLRVGELRNRGATAARGQLLAFVDADHEIVSGWVQAASSLLEDDEVAGAGATCVPPDDGTWVQHMYGRLRGRQQGRQDVEWLGSGNLVLKKPVFVKLGGFDTSLEVCEDVDLCQRVRKAGWRLVSDGRLASIHHGDPATLAALLRSEMWRARDNLKVSLRRLTLRGLPSVVIPVADVVCLAVVPIGVVAAPWGGLWATAAAAAVVAGFAALRSLRILRSPGTSGPVAWAEAFVVAITYDVARALALVVRRRHRHVR